jgi:uncharacterized protein YbdZ (MbtH family)
LCLIKDTCHSTAVLLCWHSQSHSFFHSCHCSARFMHSFWALNPHIPPGWRSKHLNKRKQELLAFQSSVL